MKNVDRDTMESLDTLHSSDADANTDTNADTNVYIVSCTRKKIWDFDSNVPKKVPKKVPAKDAYKGSTFLKWLQYIEQNNVVKWYIFSSKYGIIEPDYPIENYDIHFVKNNDKAISEDVIIEQIKRHGIHKAKNVYFVGSGDYYDKLKRIFEGVGIVLRRFKFSNSSQENL